MKKVMVLYSTGGMGHKKAALAVFEAFKKNAGDIEITNIDTLKFGNFFYRFVYLDIYVFLMTRAKWLWGNLYRFFDNDAIYRFFKKVHQNFDLKGLAGFEEMLFRENPDAIVTTHFVLPPIAEILKKNGDFTSRLYVIVTDYGPHSFWLSSHIDSYFLGSNHMIPLFEKRGIPREKMDVTGIPVMEDFSRDYDKEEVRARYGLDAGKKTIFILSGGFGVGPMEAILKVLRACKSDIQVITVCGHNKKAYQRIDALRKKLNYPVILFGFTDKVAELMSVSDLMITKAGGISVTEALSMRLPMILFASLPGQETWNEDFLISSGAALKARNMGEIAGLADKLLLSGAEYEKIKAGIEKIRKPGAAEDIVRIVKKEIGA